MKPRKVKVIALVLSILFVFQNVSLGQVQVMNNMPRIEKNGVCDMKPEIEYVKIVAKKEGGNLIFKFFRTITPTGRGWLEIATGVGFAGLFDRYRNPIPLVVGGTGAWINNIVQKHQQKKYLDQMQEGEERVVKYAATIKVHKKMKPFLILQGDPEMGTGYDDSKYLIYMRFLDDIAYVTTFLNGEHIVENCSTAIAFNKEDVTNEVTLKKNGDFKVKKKK